MKLLHELIKISKHGKFIHSSIEKNLFSFIACELEQGNYNMINNYKNIDNEWTVNDEINFIKWMLKRINLNIHDEFYILIKSEINQEEKCIGFAKILHLFVTIDTLLLLYEQEEYIKQFNMNGVKGILSDEEEYIKQYQTNYVKHGPLKEFLDNHNIILLVDQGIPLPCLIYVNAIINSQLDNELKYSIIFEIGSNIIHNLEVFDSLLAKLVLDVIDVSLKNLMEQKDIIDKNIYYDNEYNEQNISFSNQPYELMTQLMINILCKIPFNLGKLSEKAIKYQFYSITCETVFPKEYVIDELKQNPTIQHFTFWYEYHQNKCYELSTNEDKNKKSLENACKILDIFYNNINEIINYLIFPIDLLTLICFYL